MLLAAVDASGQDRGALADSLFRQAVALAKAGKYAEAAAKFQSSYQLQPALGALLGLAMAEERSGRLARAQGHYERLLEASKTAHDQKREQVARARLAALAPRVPQLVIAPGKLPAGSDVALDGIALPASALGTPLPVDPGSHVVHVGAADGRTYDKTIEIGEGQRTTVEPALAPRVAAKSAPPPPVVARHAPPPKPAPQAGDAGAAPRHGSAWRTVGIVTGGVGVALAGVGAYLWFKSGSTYNDLASRCPGACKPGDRSAIDSGRSQEDAGRLLLIGGAAAMAAGAVMFVLGASRSAEHPPAVSAAIGPGRLELRGRF